MWSTRRITAALKRSAGLLGRQLEGDDLPAEATGLDRAVEHAGDQPRAASDLRGPAQADPEIQAEQKAAERDQQVRDATLRAILPHPVANQRCQVDAHERDERAE